jgi:hypothetical protein
MRCKQCGDAFSKTEPYDLWELKRQYVQHTAGGVGSNVHTEDAGVFCSRTCLKDYLRTGEKSGIFNVPKPT